MDSAALNSIDYIVIAVVLVSTLFAFIRGFIGSFLSLTGWILSIYLAYLLYPQAKPFLEEKVSNELLLLMFGHSALLLGFLIIFGIFNMVATTAVKGLTKGIIDRILGAGFGIFRGAVIVTFVFSVAMSSLSILKGGNGDDISTAKDYTPETLKKAQVFPMLTQGQEMMKDFIPNTFYERIQVAFDSISKKTKDERFVDSMMQKLAKDLSKEQMKDIDKNTEEDMLNMSIEEAEANKLSQLLQKYQEGGNTEGKISKQDIRRIENLISKNLKPKESVDLKEPLDEDLQP